MLLKSVHFKNSVRDTYFPLHIMYLINKITFQSKEYKYCEEKSSVSDAKKAAIILDYKWRGGVRHFFAPPKAPMCLKRQFTAPFAVW